MAEEFLHGLLREDDVSECAFKSSVRDFCKRLVPQHHSGHQRASVRETYLFHLTWLH